MQYLFNTVEIYGKNIYIRLIKAFFSYLTYNIQAKQIIMSVYACDGYIT